MLRFLNDTYIPMDPEAEAAIAVLLVVYLGIFFVLFAVAIATYILQGLALYKMASRRGINNPWLAWVPVGATWIMGSLSDQYQYVAKGKTTNRRKILLVLGVGSVVAYFVAVVFGFLSALIPPIAFISLFLGLAMSVASIAMSVFTYIALYDIYASADPGNASLYLILSIFVSITQPIFVFICRNKDGGMPPRKTAPVAEPVVEEAPIVEETPVTDEGFALPEEFVEEPAETEAEQETAEPAE